MKTLHFEHSTPLALPLETVFDFFSKAENLEKLTPPWLRFEILTPEPIEMGVGTLLDYRLRIRGLPIRWRGEITTWDPPYVFVDEQRRGPYRFWRHEHRFVETSEGVRIEDRVEYAVWGGSLIARLFVQPDLRLVFDYRTTRLEEIFSVPARENLPSLAG